MNVILNIIPTWWAIAISGIVVVLLIVLVFQLRALRKIRQRELSALETDEASLNSTDQAISDYYPLPSNAQQPQAKRKAKGKPHLMMVDDDYDICQYIKSELGDDYEIETFSNGREALERVLTDAPDLIVSDAMMAGLDGFAFCQRVKQNAKLMNIPFILLTTKPDAKSAVDILKADAYIPKPFYIEDLRSSVRSLLS